MRHRNCDLLVDPAWLRTHLDDRSMRVVDCTVEMVPRPDGPSLYEDRRHEWLNAIQRRKNRRAQRQNFGR